MQRTLNYTGRKKVEQKEALFSFADEAAEPPEFNVVFNIDASKYPQNASLFVEAYHKETRQRFDFGTVSRIAPPSDRKLGQIDLSGPTLFRVLVVDETARHGLLLASGEAFRADAGKDDDENKSSLLTVKARPLGQLTWKLNFETGGVPELYLNNSIPNAIEKMKTDPTFQTIILPAALREVLIYFLWNGEDEGNSESCERWMAFSSSFADAKPESNDPYDLLIWVDEVVESFSERFHLCDMLVNACRGDNE